MQNKLLNVPPKCLGHQTLGKGIAQSKSVSDTVATMHSTSVRDFGAGEIAQRLRIVIDLD